MVKQLWVAGKSARVSGTEGRGQGYSLTSTPPHGGYSDLDEVAPFLKEEDLKKVKELLVEVEDLYDRGEWSYKVTKKEREAGMLVRQSAKANELRELLGHLEPAPAVEAIAPTTEEPVEDDVEDDDEDVEDEIDETEDLVDLEA